MGQVPLVPKLVEWMLTLTGVVPDALHSHSGRELMISVNAGRSWRFIRRCWYGCSESSKESALLPVNKHEEHRKLQASGLQAQYD